MALRGSVLGGDDAAQTFMMAAMLVYAVVAAACSSPQTAEINASKRAATLMKWVYLGFGQAAIFIVIALMVDKNKWPVIAGGGLAGGLLWVSYAHAKHAGLASAACGTED